MTGPLGSSSQETAKIRVNPRSTGIISSTTYEKHTKHSSLKPEAQELARCQKLGIHTEHVFPVRLIDFNEQENRLTTERISGNELFLTLWNPTYFFGRLRGHKLSGVETILDRVTEVGRWLRKYHESSANSLPEGSDGGWMEAAFHRKIEDIRKSRLIPEAKLARIEYKFGTELIKLKQPDFLSSNGAFPCRIHGDFLVYNILIDSQKNLHVLDFGDTRISGNLEDVSRFYSSLWAIAQTNGTRRKLLGDLPQRFLKAYGVSPEIADTPYFRCNLVYNFLTHLEGQNYMRDLLSWNSNREMSQITRAGMKWVYQQI
ncbi:Phosphotransferase enzyme family protein [Marinobacter antarcticus]|uniref:Phosphotransferase enzyme family protein n=1 Tax=Marinobacter antarcticus TaxID=564117 RepID=A0A1M6SN23_9GAMM|nr:phosphotransferase [Marinobacter antarcticus]SHK46174.1 Phosphotransferase enzyme family protein [Marinobacter antarcticus]